MNFSCNIVRFEGKNRKTSQCSQSYKDVTSTIANFFGTFCHHLSSYKKVLINTVQPNIKGIWQALTISDSKIRFISWVARKCYPHSRSKIWEFSRIILENSQWSYFELPSPSFSKSYVLWPHSHLHSRNLIYSLLSMLINV